MTPISKGPTKKAGWIRPFHCEGLITFTAHRAGAPYPQRARETPSPREERGLGRCRWLVASVAWLVLAVAVVAAPPAWLLEDAKIIPLAAKETPLAEVLRDEIIITVGPKGEWTETQRYSARVRLPGGEGAASMSVSYVEKSDKITSANAWLVAENKKRAQTYSRREWQDVAAMNQTTMYTDFRQYVHRLNSAVMVAGGFYGVGAAVGDVYGGEVTVVRRHKTGQTNVSFGGSYPVRHGRLKVQVPPGWEPDLFWLQGQGPAPTISADRTVWQWKLTDVPAVKSEAWAPERAGHQVASVVVRPPANLDGVYPRLNTWGDFAHWSVGATNPSRSSSPELKPMVTKLTAGLTDPWATIEALTKFTQKQTYIQQYYNSGPGFGYRPRLASEVLASGYGDCKDKANLMKELLREAGFQVHFAVVVVGNGRKVRPEWPGQQFNHAIVAIELPAGVEHPAAVTHPVYGRLLFFDPTHPWVPLGQLPWQEQGGYALICDERETALTTMPAFAPEQAWSSEAQVDLSFRENGIVLGVLTEKVAGEPAAEARRRAAEYSPAKLRQYWTDRFARSLSGIKVREPVGKELSAGGYETELEFGARSFGQWAQDKLLVLRLDVFTRDTIPGFPEKTRRYPVLVRPVHDVLVVRFDLPPALTAPELPAAQILQSEFGHYEGTYRVSDGWLIFRRTLTLKSATVPPEKYAAWQAFLLAVAKAEATSVALVHTPPPLASVAREGPPPKG